MNLISGIEIGYFRTIYKETLTNIPGLTIFFGRNDSGKSNFLRALNLFFNGHTNPSQAFRFDRDFCHARLAEATASRGARKFIYVKLWFNTPKNWQSSLGTSFYVKKSWSITRETEANLETSVSAKRQQYLTRFLNKVRFHYIPAIKDRHIFEELLGRVYSVLASQEDFNASLNNFSSELRARTAELSHALKTSLSLESFIAPPTDLLDLFRSLDFDTKGHQGDSYSLTLQRGDGVQVRHIPEILAFLSDKSDEDFHVWGFEEPENSLELAAAIKESQRFLAFSRDDNKQIFVTSHSPAFFNLEGDNAVRFLVHKREYSETNKREISVALPIDSSVTPSEMMGETPFLSVISSYLKDAAQKITNLEQARTDLASHLAKSSRPILFVEGESDRTVLEKAWVLYSSGTTSLDIEACEGTSRMESFGRDGQALQRLSGGRFIAVLVDNDKDGRDLYKNGQLEPGGRWRQHSSNKTWWCRLPITAALKAIMTKFAIPSHAWPGTLENIFSNDVRQRARSLGHYQMAESPYEALLSGGIYRAIASVIKSETLPDCMYLLAPSSEHKVRFANWIAAEASSDQDLLIALKPIITQLEELISSATKPVAKTASLPVPTSPAPTAP